MGSACAASKQSKTPLKSSHPPPTSSHLKQLTDTTISANLTSSSLNSIISPVVEKQTGLEISQLIKNIYDKILKENEEKLKEYPEVLNLFHLLKEKMDFLKTEEKDDLEKVLARFVVCFHILNLSQNLIHSSNCLRFQNSDRKMNDENYIKRELEEILRKQGKSQIDSKIIEFFINGIFKDALEGVKLDEAERFFKECELNATEMFGSESDHNAGKTLTYNLNFRLLVN